MDNVLQRPTIFKGAYAAAIVDKTSHSGEYEYVNNYIKNNTSNLEIAPNSSTILLTSNNTNNSIQGVVSSTSCFNTTTVLFWFSSIKIFRRKVPCSNNYISPQKEHVMKVDKITSDFFQALQNASSSIKDNSSSSRLSEYIEDKDLFGNTAFIEDGIL